jgi:hypothetical protein
LDNVAGLVYLAAFSLDVGESCASVQQPFPPSLLASTSYPTAFDAPGAPRGPDLYINRERFRETFCADAPVDTAEAMFATKRPLSLAALTENATAAGWKTKPSWYLVSENDNAIPPDAERFMAERMGATTKSLAGSHTVFIAQPRRRRRVHRRGPPRRRIDQTRRGGIAMTTRTTAIDHPSRRLVVALPQTYDEAREHYESLVPEVDFARFSEMTSWQATLELAEINAPHAAPCITHRVPAGIPTIRPTNQPLPPKPVSPLRDRCAQRRFQEDQWTNSPVPNRHWSWCTMLSGRSAPTTSTVLRPVATST